MIESSRPFEWDDIGDLSVGRPNLGDVTSVTVFRLMQFSMRYVLEERFGVDETDAMLRRAGRLAGKEFAATQLHRSGSPQEYLEEVASKMIDLRVGVLRAEKADFERMELVLTVSEDLDCSGVPVTGRPICSFDAGFIAGVFERFAGRQFEVKEIDCWATGAKLCRFTVRPA
ncbi:MAG: V4R domain-containing protein [Methanomassiliicoccus sp.]|nr:V4R domain-containing protein [Methanomassiliicoccus sp.]